MENDMIVLPTKNHQKRFSECTPSLGLKKIESVFIASTGYLAEYTNGDLNFNLKTNCWYIL